MKTTRNCRLAVLAAALGMAAQVGLHAAVVNSVDALRAAIAAAEPGEVIHFDSSLSGQILDITGAQIVLTHDLTIDASGLSGPITLFGHRTEANESFVFVVSAGATVNLRGLNFRTDDAPVIDNAGALTITSC